MGLQREANVVDAYSLFVRAKRKDSFIDETLYSLISSLYTHTLFICFNLLRLGEHRFHDFHPEITVDSRL